MAEVEDNHGGSVRHKNDGGNHHLLTCFADGSFQKMPCAESRCHPLEHVPICILLSSEVCLGGLQLVNLLTTSALIYRMPGCCYTAASGIDMLRNVRGSYLGISRQVAPLECIEIIVGSDM